MLLDKHLRRIFFKNPHTIDYPTCSNRITSGYLTRKHFTFLVGLIAFSSRQATDFERLIVSADSLRSMSENTK